MNKKKTAAILLGLLTLFWTGFIFSMSLQPADQSNELSGGLLTIVLGFLQSVCKIPFSAGVLHHLIRKLAHFGEFFILGSLSAGFLYTVKKPLLFALLYGALVAAADETLQFFTGGRAMRVADMAIDVSGVCTALIFLSLCFLWHKNQKNR